MPRRDSEMAAGKRLVELTLRFRPRHVRPWYGYRCAKYSPFCTNFVARKSL